MLTMIWAELDTISAQIDLLQSERKKAKLKNDFRRVGELAAELGRAIDQRELLVSQIGALVGAGEKSAVVVERFSVAA